MVERGCRIGRTRVKGDKEALSWEKRHLKTSMLFLYVSVAIIRNSNDRDS
jgi:hypothetical protein